jgi:steroid delta-isomerase-like uncharacterized protein
VNAEPRRMGRQQRRCEPGYARYDVPDGPLEANKQIVLRFYDELWNRGNFDAADELVAEDYVRHDLRPAEAPPGPAGQSAVAKRFRAAFPDVHLQVEALVAEGEIVVARWTISGTHTGAWGGIAPTGRSVRFTGVNFFRLADGKIAEIWNVRDDLGLREQVGAPVYAGYPKDPEG